MLYQRPRAGISITELLVVVLIVAIVGTLGFTFLIKMRSRSALVQCAFNLKTIGEGIYHYDGRDEVLASAKLGDPRGESHGTLPSARIADGYATWAVEIAPYLSTDQPLHEWELKVAYREQRGEVRRSVLATYFCPARKRSTNIGPQVVENADRHPLGSLGDYACAVSDSKQSWTTTEADGAIILAEAKFDGEQLESWRSLTGFSSLARGRSNTILVGEKHVPKDKMGHAEVGDGSIYDGGLPASFSRIGGPGFGLAPSPMAPFNTNFGSYHVGLCQFLMADLSVRRLNDNISEEILGGLIRRQESAEGS